MRKIFISIIVTVLLMIPFSASAVYIDYPYSIDEEAPPLEGEVGYIGSSIHWSYDPSTTTLTLVGEGDTDSRLRPWGSYEEEITTVIVGEGITGVEGLNYMPKLTRIDLPSTLKSLGDCRYDTSLAKIDIPESVTYLGGFSGCTSLTNIVLPSNLTQIEVSMFANCRSLEAINIPNNITFLGAQAFKGCTNLKRIDFPDWITGVAYGLFEGCESLESIYLPDTVTKIDHFAFSNCKSLKNVRLPNYLEEMGNFVFSGCSNLTSVKLPENLTEIMVETFKNCLRLESFDIHDGIETINEYAFYMVPAYEEDKDVVNKVTEVRIPESVKTIEKGAFCGRRENSSPKNILFYGDAPSVIGKGDDSWLTHSFRDDDTLYYLPWRTGWTDSEYYDPVKQTWKGYKLLPWDGKTVPVGILGDLNSSGGDPDVLDGVVMQRILASLEPEITAADLNRDGIVNVADGVVMQRILAGLE